MKPVTFMHTADLHLGTPFRGLPPRVGNIRRRELMQALTAMVEICNERHLDLLLIAGDLWEHDYVTRPLVDFVADQFRRIPYTKVIIAPGEADYFDTESFYRYTWPANVHIFRSSAPDSLYLSQAGVTVHGLGWTSPQGAAPDWSQLKCAQGVNIVLAHGSSDFLDLESIPNREKVSYFALGSSHRHQTYSGQALQPGSPEPLGFGEVGQHGVLLGTLGVDGASVEFVPLSKRQFVTLPVPVSAGQSSEEVAGWVISALASLGPEKNLFRLLLAGETGKSWCLSSFEQLLTDVFYCQIDDSTVPYLDLQSLEREHGQDVVARFIQALAKQESDSINRRALNYGLDALLGRGVELW